MVKVLLIGSGGYGVTYIKELLAENKKAVFAGVADPYAKNGSMYEELIKNHIPIYDDAIAFYEENTADIAVISSPIVFHKEQIEQALSKGSHVLCEKPLAATIDDVIEINTMQEKYGRRVFVGFQWSFAEALIDLKSDIQSGLLGKPKDFKMTVLWPRGKSYYTRGIGWAGKIKMDGGWILDSVANNATAHYLQTMLFILGKKMNESAMPSTCEAELYRANDIENYDTCALRLHLEDGMRLLYIVSHAVSDKVDPRFVYDFENATVTIDNEKRVKALFKDGKSKEYGNPDSVYCKKLWDVVDFAQNKSEPFSTVDSVVPFTKVINAMQDSVVIKTFDGDIIKTKGEFTYAQGLFEGLLECYEKGALPSELGFPWASEKVSFNVKDYSHFKGGRE